jgi:Secretion system C-terminal sorting domain
MKTNLTFFMVVIFSLVSFGQSIQFNSMVATLNNNGLNVNLKVTTFNGAGYLSHSYQVIDNEIFLSVCYWFDTTLPIYQLENNFPIIVANNQQNYTILLETFNSSSQTVCDNFSAGPTAVATYLETATFDKKSNQVYPNPFATNFDINTSIEITNFKIIDLLGKTVIQTNSKFILDSQTESLKPGIYFLELIFENGKREEIKLIKN